MTTGLNICSEIGELRKVMLHRPGDELLNLSPDNIGRLLFDDIPFLETAQAEHDRFAQMLRDEGVEVLYLDQLVAEALAAYPMARESFIRDYVAECGIDGPGVREAVRQRLEAIDDPRELVEKAITGVRTDEVDLASVKDASLADVMEAGGGDENPILVDPIPNVYFTRDTFSVIGSGVSLNRMRSATRRRESLFGRYLFTYHPEYSHAPIWYDPASPYHIEGGDILVLSANVIGVGISERTQPAAIDRLAKHLLWSEQSPVRAVYAFSIPVFSARPRSFPSRVALTRARRASRRWRVRSTRCLPARLGSLPCGLSSAGETTQSLRRASSGTTAPTPWPCVLAP